MTMIGYARVSTDEQSLIAQTDVLRAAGCVTIFEEHASGVDRERPQLACALAAVGRGDTLVVARLDRVARSQIHLLEVVRDLDKRGAFFRSLGDPIDTGSLQGRLMFGMLAAFAEFERGLIIERTMAGVAAARARGRIGGNPALKTAEGCQALAAHRRALKANAAREGRNAPVPPAPPPKPPRQAVVVVASLLRSRPGMTLRAIGAELTALGERPACGGAWAPASVGRLVERAGAAGLLQRAAA
jgi:DNA invertase Pin-like site-specific DNA recombinase